MHFDDSYYVLTLVCFSLVLSLAVNALVHTIDLCLTVKRPFYASTPKVRFKIRSKF